MDYNKVEDAAMKDAMNYFKDHAVRFLGIKEKVIAPAETELKNIDIKTNQMDYFGDIESKKKFREVISMTEIGKMIFIKVIPVLTNG